MDWFKVAGFVWNVLIALASAGAFAVSWYGRKERASKAALEALEQKMQDRLMSYEDTQDRNHQTSSEALAGLRERMAGIEETLKHVPTARDIANLVDSVNLLSNATSQLRGEVGATTRMVERMNQFLMERGS